MDIDLLDAILEIDKTPVAVEFDFPGRCAPTAPPIWWLGSELLGIVLVIMSLHESPSRDLVKISLLFLQSRLTRLGGSSLGSKTLGAIA